MSFDLLAAYIRGDVAKGSDDEARALAYLDQLEAATDEMAETTGITFDGKTPMPFPLTRRTINGLWDTAMRAWHDDLACDHAYLAAPSPLPLYFLPIAVDGPFGVYCGPCSPAVHEADWANLPRSTVRRMHCDACGKRKFREWRDIFPIATNQLEWAMIARCCWECRNVLTYNRQDLPLRLRDKPGDVS